MKTKNKTGLWLVALALLILTPHVGLGQTLTELRTNAPTALIPFPRELVWQPVGCDASRVAIIRPAGTGAVLLYAEHVLTNALAEAGSVVNPPTGTETCTITLINGPVSHPDGSDEVYALATTSNSVTITAPMDAGLLYGAQTLCQLLIGPTNAPRIAGCSITDWPAFGIRGFMHDVGRNFQSIDLLKHAVSATDRRDQPLGNPRTGTVLYPGGDARLCGILRGTKHHGYSGDRHSRTLGSIPCRIGDHHERSAGG